VPAAARLAPGPAARSAQRPAGRHAPPSVRPGGTLRPARCPRARATSACRVRVIG